MCHFKRSSLKTHLLDGTYLEEIKKLNRTKLLILDDFGLQAFDNFAREALLDIVGENNISDAILERIVNSSHRINLNGECLRKGMLKND